MADSPHNPRFPFTLKVYRPVKSSDWPLPSDDDDVTVVDETSSDDTTEEPTTTTETASTEPTYDTTGEYVLDANGDPVYTVVKLAKVAMADGWMVRDGDGKPVVDSYVEEIECGYRTNTRNTAEYGDVVVYNVTLHTPPFTTPLNFDDILEITDYDRTFRAKMVKKATFNWGSDIWFDEIKN